MEEQRKIFRTFLSMHAHKARPTDEPTAHLVFYEEVIPPDVPLLAFTREDVVTDFNVEGSDLVRWLLEQMRTYDCRRQRIVGLIFDDSVVLSEVLEMPPGKDVVAHTPT